MKISIRLEMRSASLPTPTMIAGAKEQMTERILPPNNDPETATRELQRCIRDFGFDGALVNGYTELDGEPVHYDLPQYRPFWRALEALDVPFYLHPRPPMAGVSPLYDGHPWLFVYCGPVLRHPAGLI